MEVKIDNDLEKNIDIDLNSFSMDGEPYDPNRQPSRSFDDENFDETPEKLTAKGYNVKKVKKLDLGNSGDPTDSRRAALSRNLKSISFSSGNPDAPTDHIPANQDFIEIDLTKNRKNDIFRSLTLDPTINVRTTQTFADSKPTPDPADLFTGHDNRRHLYTSTKNSQSLGKYPDLTWSDPQTPYPNLIGIDHNESLRLLPDNASPEDKKKLDSKLCR
jgi:hypothetical protein